MYGDDMTSMANESLTQLTKGQTRDQQQHP